MPNTRKHVILSCAILCCAGFLSACATSPATSPTDTTQETVATTTTAADRWNDERQRIIDALTDSSISTHIQDDDSLLLRLAAARGFERDSVKPTAELMKPLSEVADILAQVPETSVQIIGHTDSVGSEVYNLQLSIRRAEAVMEYLRQNGVGLARLSADGHGEAEPIADNRKPAGRAENRRVEILVRPIE